MQECQTQQAFSSLDIICVEHRALKPHRLSTFGLFGDISFWLDNYSKDKTGLKSWEYPTKQMSRNDLAAFLTPFFPIHI